MSRDFLRSEDGAVTVDWVVLTGALVGLGLATTAVVSGGVENLSQDTAEELANTSIVTRFMSSVFGDDFENGTGSWTGAGTSFSEAWGNVLGPVGGSGGLQAVRNTYDIEDGMGYAVVEFDMYAIDSWDGESFVIYANDEAVATASFRFGTDGNTGTWVTDNDNYSFSVSQTSSAGANQAYSEGWPDQSSSMQLVVANPGDEISIGFGSTLDQGVSDESWAVDNITVTGTNDP